MLSVQSANSKVALTTVPLCTVSKEQLCNLTVSGGPVVWGAAIQVTAARLQSTE